MPKRLGINVNVVDINDNAYIEYGLQNDNRVSVKRSKVSTFIEAKNGAHFFIRVTVDNPFKFEEKLNPIGKLFEDLKKREPAPQVKSKHEIRTKHFDDNRPAEEEVHSFTREAPAISKVPFDLMVSVFIDGRAKPECRQMIYLDPKHPRYNSRCILKGRWVDAGEAYSRDGRAGLMQWVFADRGIDHILGKLNVQKTTKTTSRDVEEAEMSDLCDEFTTGGLEDDKEDRPVKAGQIDVCFRRVISVGGDADDQKFKAYHYAGSDEKPREIDDECTHTTSFVPKTTSVGPAKIQTFALRHVGWSYYQKNEDAWARFTFNYTARYKLMNLGLSEPNGKPTLKGRTYDPAPDRSSKRGKKRASSFDAEEDEDQAWAERPVAKKPSRAPAHSKESKNGDDSEDDISEEHPDNAAAFYHEHRTRYELRATRVRLGNYENAKVEDEADRIS